MPIAFNEIAMGWLNWLLFESLPALGAVLGVVLFVLLVHWRRTRRGRPALIGLVVAVVLLAVQALVVTRREHAERILGLIEKDLVASRTVALAAALAPDFDAGGLDRDGFLAYVRQQLQLVKVRWLDRWALQMEESGGDRFVASATYLADVSGEGYVGSTESRWALTFVRTSDGWKIAAVRPLHVAGLDNPRWQDFGHSRSH
jgi:hypothetical protein